MTVFGVRPALLGQAAMFLIGTAVETGAAAQQASRIKPEGLEEVVVTARKREETLLEVPLAITAITAEQLERKDIKSLSEVAAFTPSLSVTSYGGSTSSRFQQTVVIRGLAPSTILDSTTTVFINGAPLSYQGVIGGIYDVARVEVIKGPQSAYFGRQTFAGAINLITKDPSTVPHANVGVLYGSDNWFDAHASIEGPIVSDKLAVRLSGRYYQVGGQYANPGDPAHPFGSQSSRNLSGEVRFTPTDDLEFKLFTLYVRDLDGEAALGKFKRVDYNCNAGAAAPGTNNFICGTLPTSPRTPIGQNDTFDPVFLGALSNPFRPFDIGLHHGGTANNIFHGNLAISYAMSNLGLTLSSITAGDRSKGEAIFDIANENVSVGQHYLTDTENDNAAFSQELRLTSDQARRFRWSIGGNYQWSRHGQYNAGTSPFGLAVYSTGSPNQSDTKSVFASAAYDLSSQFIVNLEGRYQSDHVAGYNKVNSQGAITEQKVQEVTTHDFTPRVILQYKFDRAMQVYATYSRGVNPGLFNSFTQYPPATLALIEQATGAGLSAKPEKLNNWELGFKGDLLDGRLQFDADVYYDTWINQIIQQVFYVVQPTSILVASAYNNAGRTTLKGVELNAAFQATHELRLDIAAAVNDSRVSSYACSCTSLVAKLPPFTSAPLDLFSGKQLPVYSKYGLTLGAEYTHPIGAETNAYARIDYTYKSGFYDSVANLAKTQDAHRVNVRAGIDTGHYRVEAFVENLLNNRAFTSIENSVDVLSPGFADRVLNVGLPVLRRAGVRVNASF